MVCDGGDECGVVLFEGQEDVVYGTGEGLERVSGRDECEVTGVVLCICGGAWDLRWKLEAVILILEPVIPLCGMFLTPDFVK